MTPQWKLIVRTFLVFLIAACTTLVTYGGWLAIVAAAIVAGCLAVVEFFGPTSDAGIKWSPGGGGK